MNKLRIGMVSLCYQPTINGVVQMIDLYREQLEALGHEVTIFTLGRENTAVSNIITSRGMPLGNSGYYVNFILGKEARTQMAQMDILHCHHLFLTMSLAHRYGQCPVVYTNHTRYDLYAQNIFSLPKQVAQHLMRVVWLRTCQLADVVIAPSNSLNQLLTQIGVKRPIVTIENGIAQRPFITPSNPINKAELGVPENTFLLIYVGRLSKEKNVSGLLVQFSKVVQRTPHAHLLLVGDGPDLVRLQQLCKSENLTDHVTFCGEVAPKQVPNYLAVSDLFVTASTTEVHPLTLLEAMVAGLPIVAPHAPGNQDIVLHHESGLLVESVDGLADAIAQLANDSQKRQKMVQIAKREAQRYSIDQTVQKTLELYQKLLFQPSDNYPNWANGRLASRFWAKMMLKRRFRWRLE